jgi:hypothetical protein
MEIKYLKKLEANPNEISAYDGTIIYTIKGMTEEEIQGFETYLINKFTLDSNYKFPQAYREYLYLAGNGNYFFEIGGENHERLQRIADHILEFENVTLPHPFCAVDVAGDDIIGFYLTDTNEDPVLRQILFPDISQTGNLEIVEYGTLKSNIDWKIGRMLEGESYF